MVPRWFLLFVAVNLIAARSARADQDELSLGVSGSASWVWEGHRLSPHEVDETGMLGLGLLGSYGLRDALAVDFALSLERAAATLEYNPAPGDVRGALPGSELRLWSGQLLGRAEVGLSGRFGVTWIRVVQAGVGLQMRLDKEWIDERGEYGGGVRERGWRWGSGGTDAVVKLGLGLDRRFGKRWVVGTRAVARQALRSASSYRSVSLVIQMSWYWYPY